jgi:hypothetical protein
MVTLGNPANFWSSVHLPPPPLRASPADSGVSVVDEVPSAFRPQVTLGLAYSLCGSFWHKKKARQGFRESKVYNRMIGQVLDWFLSRFPLTPVSSTGQALALSHP